MGLDRDETGRGVDENPERHLLTGLGSAFLCPPSGRPFLPRHLRAPQTDDAPACPGGWTSGRCEFSEHRIHRKGPYCARTRLCGLEEHSTRTRQKHGLFFPFQAPCPDPPSASVLSLLLHQVDSKHEFLLQVCGSTPLSRLFAHLFSQTCTSWKCDA